MAGPDDKESFEVDQIKRNPWLLGLSASPIALIPVLWALAIATGQPFIAFPTIHFALIGIFMSLWVWRRNPWRRTKRVRVEVDEQAITVGDERVDRKKLTRGVIVPRGGEIEVHL